MYFYSYENFVSRLSSFTGGKYYIDLLRIAIPEGSEKCFLSSEKMNNEPIRYFIANDEKIVDGMIDWFGEERLEVSFTSYQRKDITSVNVILSNPNSTLHEYTRLKEMQINISFYDGTKLTLNKQDYSSDEVAFSNVLQHLIV